jgi:hypothetical protein
LKRRLTGPSHRVVHSPGVAARPLRTWFASGPPPSSREGASSSRAAEVVRTCWPRTAQRLGPVAGRRVAQPFLPPGAAFVHPRPPSSHGNTSHAFTSTAWPPSRMKGSGPGPRGIEARRLPGQRRARIVSLWAGRGRRQFREGCCSVAAARGASGQAQKIVKGRRTTAGTALTHARTLAHSHTRTHTRAHTHAHIHARTHTHTHARTHAQGLHLIEPWDGGRLPPPGCAGTPATPCRG